MGEKVILVSQFVVPQPPLHISVSSYDSTMHINVPPMYGYSYYTIEARGYVRPKLKVTRLKRKGWIKKEWLEGTQT